MRFLLIRLSMLLSIFFLSKISKAGEDFHRSNSYLNDVKDDYETFQAAPNPCSRGNDVSITIADFQFEPGANKYELAISNVLGKQMSVQDVSSNGNAVYVFPTTHLPPGTYYYSLRGPDPITKIKTILLSKGLIIN